LRCFGIARRLPRRGCASHATHNACKVKLATPHQLKTVEQHSVLGPAGCQVQHNIFFDFLSCNAATTPRSKWLGNQQCNTYIAKNYENIRRDQAEQKEYVSKAKSRDLSLSQDIWKWVFGSFPCIFLDLYHKWNP
jgi:hypothetical protein